MFDYKFIKILEEFKYFSNCSNIYKDYRDMEITVKYNYTKIKNRKAKYSLLCDNNRAENFLNTYNDFIMYYGDWYMSF